VFLVHGLSRHAEGLGYLGPCPSRAQCVLDGGVFELIGKLPQGDNCSELVGGRIQRI
jgi:hypothetical protein